MHVYHNKKKMQIMIDFENQNIDLQLVSGEGVLSLKDPTGMCHKISLLVYK